MRKGSVVALILVFVFGMIAGAFLGPKVMNMFFAQDDEKQDEVINTVNINLESVSLSDIEQTLSFNGEVTAGSEYIITAELTERIRRIHVTNGMRVNKGDLLFELEDLNHTQKFRQAEANLKSARSNLEKAEKDLERNRTLFNKKVINESTFDEVKRGYDNAHSAFINAEASYEMAKKDFGSLKVTSPQDGIFVDSNGEPGQMINPGFVFGRVLDLDSVVVECMMTAAGVNRISVGSKAYIDENIGEVISINNAADRGSRTFLVKIAFNNIDRNFLEGSFVQGDIVINKFEDVPVLDKSWVLYDQRGYYVFTVTDEEVDGDIRTKAVKKYIDITVRQDERIYSSRIGEGYSIVSSGHAVIEDGSYVRITEE
ncbi:MAG: efflux RND transporter periplasmic adaptor subunit [Candidatus Muiribacteriaceae bacterium]